MLLQKKSAFTLIELLVVIVIIGIIATIGIGTFNGYMQKARETRIFSFANDVSQELKRQAALNGTGMMASYQFENDLKDSSKNKLHLGGTGVFGKSNHSFGNHFLKSVDGVNYRHTIGIVSKRPKGLSENFSVSYTAKIPEDEGFYPFRIDAGGMFQQVFIDSYGKVVLSNSSYTGFPVVCEIDKWCHILNVYKDGTLSLYSNGNLIQQETITHPFTENIYRIMTGDIGDKGIGDLDNLEIYPIAVDISNLTPL